MKKHQVQVPITQTRCGKCAGLVEDFGAHKCIKTGQYFYATNWVSPEFGGMCEKFKPKESL